MEKVFGEVDAVDAGEKFEVSKKTGMDAQSGVEHYEHLEMQDTNMVRGRHREGLQL